MLSKSSYWRRYFYPRPPRGGRPAANLKYYASVKKFLSTPSARRATTPFVPCSTECYISIHALREEGDTQGSSTFTTQEIFLSTPSARRATGRRGAEQQDDRYFYPRPPRGGRRSEILTESVTFGISIHALREEGDHSACRYNVFTAVFLSTPSARRATANAAQNTANQAKFLSTPPRGGRRARDDVQKERPAISIHALREEGDFCCCRSGSRCAISIHALREEGDTDTNDDPFGGDGISIHALREEGDVETEINCSAVLVFLSTPSARRATSESD